MGRNNRFDQTEFFDKIKSYDTLKCAHICLLALYGSTTGP